MDFTIRERFDLLKRYCEQNDYKGWDPYDGLTSGFFRSLPLIRDNRFLRLAWIQFFKRSPVNFRNLLAVPKKHNAKGLALFLTGYCNLYKTDADKSHLDKINYLVQQIAALQNQDYSGSCWGYYFDWQARAFFQPANTPTVVATSFVTDALLNAYEITGDTGCLEMAESSTRFVLKDLNRTYDEQNNFCFSYSPLDNSQVYNASLLGARLLSRVYAITKDEQLKHEAAGAVRYACLHQQEDGSWPYGNYSFHQWIDNFHTGFNLECIYEYQQYTGDNRFERHIDKGFDFYIDNFFTEEGISKYYNNSIYPVDIHAPAQLMVTLVKLQRFKQYASLAEKVLGWTIGHMQDPKGYFYYQKKKGISSRIPYMRWAQAWMFYSLSYYLKEIDERKP